VWGWRFAVGLGGLGCLVAAVVAWLVCRDPSAEPGRAAGARGQGRSSLRAALTRDVAFLGLAGALLPLGQFCLITYLALFLRETEGIPVAASASLLVGAQVAGALGRVAWGTWSDRLFGRRRRPVLLVANGVAALGALALGWLPPLLPFWLLGALVVAFAFNALGWHSTWIALLAEIAEPGQQGQTIGVAMTLMYVGIILGPPLFGSLVDRTGRWEPSWTLLALALAIGTALVVPVREGRGP
jgi:predicted MFS family arabinose efflux permease